MVTIDILFKSTVRLEPLNDVVRDKIVILKEDLITI